MSETFLPWWRLLLSEAQMYFYRDHSKERTLLILGMARPATEGAEPLRLLVRGQISCASS